MAMDSLTCSSSSTSTPRKYDVFLSFRGEDTRTNFTDHLYTALENKSIHTFRDNDKLERGKDISPTLLKAIEDSQFAIIVFSRNYANSTWCLDEVAKIAECKERFRQTVLPVFYDVEPTHVRKQQGSFEEAFAKHRENFKDNMERVDNWIKALVQAANVSGWDLKHRHEANVIRDIVENISRALDITFPPSEDKDLVGMVYRLRKMGSYLDKELGGVNTVGLWGPGGVGKTTIAKEVFKSIRGKFEAYGFVNVREQSEKQGLEHVRRKLHEMLLDKKIKKQDVDNNELRRRLASKKVLIVLDDVDHVKQIENLVGKADQEPNWFGQGSRIIVTTRNKHLLKSYGEDNIYEIEKLTDDEALRLFCRRAFMKYDPEDEFSELSKSVVKYAQGLPLAIELLGCLLNGRSMDEWVDAVNRLEQNPTNEMCKTLQLSYEGLEKPEKQIFLDIACFFKGEEEQRVKRLLESCDFHPTIGLRILVEKSLITIEEGKVWMHDMVQEMGWEVVREEKSETRPGERSRIWLYDDSMEVLTENTGTRDVQGLFLSWNGEEKVVLLNADPFSEMKNIRLLKICNVYFSGCPQYDLSKKLRLLEWHGYPLETLPSSFRPDKLVELTMPNSRIEKLWKETEVYEKLVLINLRNCRHLTKTPDFSKVPNLECLILEGCERLTEVHPSIGVLHHLVTLNLKYCRRLEKLPKSINLKALKTFTLAGCLNLNEFPEIVGEMKNLSELDLNGTAIRELPDSISHLTGLILLTLGHCNNLFSLPGNSICNLTFLKYLLISNSSNIVKLPEDLGNYLEHLEHLFVDGTSIREVPSSVLHMKKLKVLCFRGCRGLQLPNSLSGLCSLVKLDLSFCDLAEGAISDDIGSLSLLEHLNLSGNYFTSIPETISQLSQLRDLLLLGCCMLQSLPKNLPSNLRHLDISDCYELRISDDMRRRISKNGFTLINSNNKFGFIRDSNETFGPIDTGSTFGTPLPVPEGHMDEVLPKFFEERINNKLKFEFRFPFSNKVQGCCKNWNTGSSIMIKPSPDEDHRYNIRKGIAIFIVFEIKEREIFSGDDQKSEEIHCHIHTEEGSVENFFSFHDFKDFRVGSFGACSYIPQGQFPRRLNQEIQVIGFSLEVNTPNLELRKCGMHFIHELNMKEFCHELALCNPSTRQLEGEVNLGQHCLQLLDEEIIETTRTTYSGQPHHEADENYMLEEDTSDPASQMKRDVEPLLLRFFQGRIARTCTFFFLMPPILLSPWFFHHSLGDTTFCCYLPPNLHDDKSWLGLELYVVFDRRQYSENPTLLLGVELYVHAGSNTLPVLRYDIIIDGSVLGPQLVLYHIPRGRLPEQLNQSTGISVLFTPTTQDVEVEFCGTGLLYEKESKRLVKHISNMTLGRPDNLSSLHQQAQSLILQMEEFCGNTDIGEHNGGERSPEPDFSYFSTFKSKKELIESLNKLLTHMESMTKDVSNSTLQNYRYGLRDEHGSNEEHYSISEVLLHSHNIPSQGPDQQSGALMYPNLYHSHVMVETLIHGSDFGKWKRNLEIILEESFNTCGLVTLSLKGHILSVLKYFDHRLAFNFNFPIKEIPEWFNHQSEWSASKIQLPQNLHEDKNWMGVVICAAFSVQENPSSFSESSFKILCHLMTNISCVNVVPVHSITKDKFSWLHVRGFIWLTYVPHDQLLTDLTEANYVSARIYSRSPDLMVNKCSIRLLYERDMPEFKRAIIQCWTSFFDDLDPIFGFVADEDGKLLHSDNKLVEITTPIRNKVPRPINPPKTNFRDFDGESVYNACFPPTESLKWFVDLSCDHLATINLPKDLYSDINWIGLTLCAYFSNPDFQVQPVATTSLDNLDPELFPHYLFCHFETGIGNSESIHRFQYQQSDGNPNRLDKKEFIWVSFLPRSRLLETIQPSFLLDECRILEASFGCDMLGMVVNKCGLRLLYQHDQEEFKQVLNMLMDWQQPYQEPKAEDENVQVPLTTPNAINSVFHLIKYREAKQTPLVYDPMKEFTYNIKLSSANPTNPQVTTLEDTMTDPSIAEFDDIVANIQKCLDSEGTSEPESKENDPFPTFESINRAKKIFKQFMERNLADIIHPGRKSELKHSLSILISSKNIFPNEMVDEMAKFLDMFSQTCKQYETAQNDLKEAEGKESKVVQLESTLQQFTRELKLVKMKIEAIDQEIAELGKKLAEKKAEREELRSSFEDLKGRGTSSTQALKEAKRDLEVIAKKKREAQDVVKEVEDAWQTLVARCSPHIQLL
ncbi:TIR-NBS-LRR-like protein [Trema orientale]|uniref:ADP-ribosyl cyclase/cyclic ADP-ribose hydrolase n=1 Tax=Trema orientale TaxID=63057 RepID=A0A2P5FI53_TREOI|nr:TIR-NBS-LRR-like protein [Trema orientale]